MAISMHWRGEASFLVGVGAEPAFEGGGFGEVKSRQRECGSGGVAGQGCGCKHGKVVLGIQEGDGCT